jgi:hypothetical protein
MTKPGSGSGEQRAKRIPNTDMQTEDAGTADSGNDAHLPQRDDDQSARPRSGTPAEAAMKQTSKTPSERSSG